MLLEAVVESLPMAVGVALSPAPVATFVVVSPIKFVERNIRIVFLSTRYDHLQSEFRQGEGARFLLRFPKDYFDYADSTTIKSHQVESISPLS